MPIALTDQARKKIEKTQDPGGSSGFTGAGPEFEHLTQLLVSAPIDLAGIGEEIRRHPDLESLILRLGVSLALCPDENVNTVEEAVVALGASRLRVVIDLWSSGCAIPPETGLPHSPSSNAQDSAPTTPEMRYLLSFLGSVGFDSPENAFSRSRLAAWASRIPPDQMFALTDLFMRDFFSLLPVIQPGVREVAQSRPRP